MKSVTSFSENGYSPENELQGSSSFFERVAMSGPGLRAVISGKDTRILFANPMFEQYTGFFMSHHDSKYFSSLLGPFQRDRFTQHLRDVRENPEGWTSFIIYDLRDKYNEPKSFYVYVSKIAAGENGEDEMFSLFILEDKSRWGVPFTSFDTKELFLELFKAEDFGTFEWIIDADKVFWSAGLYLIYEVDRSVQEINFSFVNGFVHPHDKELVAASLKSAIDSASGFNIEFRIITYRNNQKLIQCLASVIKDNAGKIVKLVGSIRDITNQRTIENNLKGMVDELHRSNRELEEFAYAASHDLQEPLRKITTFSDRLSEKYKDALAGEGEMYLSRMVASAENMRQLITGLLEFSRISQTSAPFEPVDLNNIVQQVMNDLELKIEESGTAIRCAVLPVIDAVGTQMKQLFQNLVSNAVKFQKPGVPPIIRIELEDVVAEELQQYKLQPQKLYYKIVVTDNGIGFENEYATRIFQVFQRLHGKSEYPGSGIGLAICKKILEYHKGVIYAESTPGVSTRFVFLLPAQQ